MADPNYSDEENGRTTPLLWAQRSKNDIDEFISQEDETTTQEILIIKDFYKRLDESGATDKAKKVADIIEGIQESSAKLQKYRRHATQEMTNYMSLLDDFDKEDTATIRMMKEDVKK